MDNLDRQQKKQTFLTVLSILSFLLIAVCFFLVLVILLGRWGIIQTGFIENWWKDKSFNATMDNNDSDLKYENISKQNSPEFLTIPSNIDSKILKKLMQTDIESSFHLYQTVVENTSEKTELSYYETWKKNTLFRVNTLSSTQIPISEFVCNGNHVFLKETSSQSVSVYAAASDISIKDLLPGQEVFDRIEEDNPSISISILSTLSGNFYRIEIQHNTGSDYEIYYISIDYGVVFFAEKWQDNRQIYMLTTEIWDSDNLAYDDSLFRP